MDDTISSKTKPSSQALHPIEDAYFRQSHLNPKVLRAFISTDVSLSTREILDRYVERRPVEVFFRQSKGRLAFERYQMRSSKGIKRYWLLMSLAHFVACTGSGRIMPFEEGHAFFHDRIIEERILYIYQCGVNRVDFTNVLTSVA